MKKTATILLGSLCALCAQAADNIYGGPDYQHRTTIKGEDVVLNPNEDSPTAEAFFGNKDQDNTIRSLTTNGSPSTWNCAFGLIIDIKSTADTFDAFSNNGTMSWSGAYSKSLVFQNSAGNSTYANIDLGTFSMLTNMLSETGSLKILTNANVTGKSFTTTNNVQLIIDNNSTVNYQINGATTFKNTSLLQIGSGSTLNATNSRFEFNGSSKAIINGVFNYTNTNSNNLVLRNAEISGAGAKLKTQVLNGTANINSQIYFNGENNIVSNGASIEATGALRLNGGSRLVIDDTAGEIKLMKTTASDILYWGRVLFAGNGELIVNKKNAFTTDNTKGFAQLTNVGGLSNPNKLTVNADNNFEGIYFQDSSRMEITVIDGVKANFNTVGRNASQDTTTTPILVELHFADFVEGTIFFDGNAWWNDDKITLTASDNSNIYTKDQLALVEVNSEFGKYALRFQIPEPSTYAAIFGAIALGLAAYRRRK